MRRFIMTFGGTLVVLGSSLLATAQDKGPLQAPEKQAPAQAPVQAPSKAVQAPVQAPTKPVQAPAPVQKPVQAPIQKHDHVQSPVQKGGAPVDAPMVTMNYRRGGLFAGRFR
jgi:outer membrane biosynthesis protein TonB